MSDHPFQEAYDLAHAGLGYTEIAKKLGISPGAAHHRVKVARAERRKVDGEEIDPKRADKLLRRFSWQGAAE